MGEKKRRPAKDRTNLLLPRRCFQIGEFMTADFLLYHRLACAIVARAVRDAKSANPSLAIEARQWLAGGDGADILDALDLDQGAGSRWVQELTPVAQMSLDFDN